MEFIPKLLKVLHELERQNALAGASERALISLQLEGGATTEGWLLDFGSKLSPDSEPLVVLYPSQGKPGEDVIGTPLSLIKGVAILKAVERVLPRSTPPSASDLEEMIKEMTLMVHDIVGKNIPGELLLRQLFSNAYPGVEKQLNVLHSALMQLLSFPLAHEAFKKRIDSFKIHISRELSVSIVDSVLMIALPLQGTTTEDIMTAMILAFSSLPEEVVAELVTPATHPIILL